MNKQNEVKVPRVICPKLVDVVNGASRITNKTYLAEKAERLGVSVEEIVENYVSKETLLALRKGETFGLSKSKIAKLIKLNGKAPKVKAPKAPAKSEAVAA